MPTKERANKIGQDWRTSDDRAWTTSGDSSGLHILVANKHDGYRWSVLTTLAEPGVVADAWIGNACVAGNGRTLVASYAPRTFTDKQQLTERGAFVATVDLRTGHVTKIPIRSTLAYYSPSCGNSSTVLITQERTKPTPATRVIELNANTGTARKPIQVAGQLTSAVPTLYGIVAADHGALIKLDRSGRRHVLAPTEGSAFDLTAGADGSVVYADYSASRARVRQISASSIRRNTRLRKPPKAIASGDLTKVGVARAARGSVSILGTVKTNGSLPVGITSVIADKDSTVSTRGDLVTAPARVRSVIATAASPAHNPRISLHSKATESNSQWTFDATPTLPEDNSGNTARPVSKKLQVHRTGTSPNNQPSPSPINAADTGLVEPGRICAVPRNDPENQAMQPKPRQVEWAVDQAVRGVLNVKRPANWKHLKMPSYTPQGLFPSRPLSGGGNVPAQILLGVLAQESNLWQAARFAVPGVTANPLIGNYYGINYYDDDGSNDWSIDWEDADCGYGVAQVTDGMRLAGKERPGHTALPYQTQRAVALDFAVNVAAGLQILQGKWNQTRNAGLTINNGDPSKIENWFYAVWAYNSGFYPESKSGSNDGAWGVGWLNNPANPRYPANRASFLDTTYQDAAHPQDWPYPEKVLGWAGHPVEVLESPGNLVSGFRPAWWNGTAETAPANRAAVKPPVNQFCTATNNCEPDAEYPPTAPDVLGEPAGPCAHQNASGQYDLKCWAHESSTWKDDCDYSCGNELLRFSEGYEYQEDGVAYAPKCSLAGLPRSALIVDDVPDGTASVRPNCARPWSNAGSFKLSYRTDTNGEEPGKIDTHQIGGGFGGHFWFTHTRADGSLAATASWRLNAAHSGPMRVLVALPDHGAQTRFAKYIVKTAKGDRVRTVVQPSGSNRWVSLGAFMFNGIPEVRLASQTPNGMGDEDIAFDAVAFVPIEGTYKEQSVEAVAEFDEDQNIDTPAPSSWIGGIIKDRKSLYEWGAAKADGISSADRCSGDVTSNCIGGSLKSAADQWERQVSEAGSDPTAHPDGNSIGTWIGFAQKFTDRPPSTDRPDWFDSDDHIKIRTKATASYVVDDDGKIVNGSEWVEYANRTGNTHLPEFLRNLVAGVQADYGISPPDLTYSTRNLNSHDGNSTTVNPLSNGVLPGRAYAFMGKKPTLVNSSGAPTSGAGDCLSTLYTAGGSIGYRAFLGAQDGVPAERFGAWVEQVDADERSPVALTSTLEDVRDTFFDPGVAPGVTASLFNVAPPIWQELSVSFCADGTVRKVSGRPLLRASHMPDEYFYINDEAATLNGDETSSLSPVMRGDFATFSRIPDPNNDYPLWENPFGPCGAATGRSGNPWDLSAADVTQGAGEDPSIGHFCLDRHLKPDSDWSSE